MGVGSSSFSLSTTGAYRVIKYCILFNTVGTQFSCFTDKYVHSLIENKPRERIAYLVKN